MAANPAFSSTSRAMAAASSSSSPPISAGATSPAAARPTSRPRPPSDVFRPRFPLDPFAASPHAHAAADALPWVIDADRLPAPHADGARPDVIVVLGGQSPFLNPLHPAAPG
jgi:hypothetical protein